MNDVRWTRGGRSDSEASTDINSLLNLCYTRKMLDHRRASLSESIAPGFANRHQAHKFL